MKVVYLRPKVVIEQIETEFLMSLSVSEEYADPNKESLSKGDDIEIAPNSVWD